MGNCCKKVESIPLINKKQPLVIRHGISEISFNQLKNQKYRVNYCGGEDQHYAIFGRLVVCEDIALNVELRLECSKSYHSYKNHVKINGHDKYYNDDKYEIYGCEKISDFQYKIYCSTSLCPNSWKFLEKCKHPGGYCVAIFTFDARR